MTVKRDPTIGYGALLPPRPGRAARAGCRLRGGLGRRGLTAAASSTSEEKAGRSVSGSVGVVRLLTRPRAQASRPGYGVPGSRPAACAGTGDLVPQVLAQLLTAYAGVVGEDRRHFGVMSKAAHIVCPVGLGGPRARRRERLRGTERGGRARAAARLRLRHDPSARLRRPGRRCPSRRCDRPRCRLPQPRPERARVPRRGPRRRAPARRRGRPRLGRGPSRAPGRRSDAGAAGCGRPDDHRAVDLVPAGGTDDRRAAARRDDVDHRPRRRGRPAGRRRPRLARIGRPAADRLPGLERRREDGRVRRRLRPAVRGGRAPVRRCGQALRLRRRGAERDPGPRPPCARKCRPAPLRGLGPARDDVARGRHPRFGRAASGTREHDRRRTARHRRPLVPGRSRPHRARPPRRGRLAADTLG